jgi:hypothetical protein
MDQVDFILVPSPGVDDPAMVQLSGPRLKPRPPDGGGVGTMIREPDLEKYVRGLEPNQPIAIEVATLGETEVSDARELARQSRRHVLLLAAGDLS